MKNLKLLVVLLLLPLSACYTSYLTKPNTYDFEEELDFTIDRVEEGKRIRTGNGYWQAGRGTKFVFVHLTFRNRRFEKRDLNFDEFILLNPKEKTKHQVEWVMVTGPINIFGKVNSYILKNAAKSRKLVFSFPEEEKPELLMVKNKVIEIPYQQ